MKNIINYLNESSNEELINKANYYADIMCISYALQDFYKSMIEGDDEKTLDLMYKISGDVSEYNTKLPKTITRYAQSTTNITADDWIFRIKHLMYDDKSSDYVKNLIVKDKKNDYAYFGTSFSKDALKRILDLFKQHYDIKGFKKLISLEKEGINNDKKNFNEFKKNH